MFYRIQNIAAFSALILIAGLTSAGTLVAYDGFFLAGLVLTLIVSREFMRRADQPLAVAVKDMVRPVDKGARRQVTAIAVIMIVCLGVMGTTAIAGLSGDAVATSTTVLAH